MNHDEEQTVIRNISRCIRHYIERVKLSPEHPKRADSYQFPWPDGFSKGDERQTDGSKRGKANPRIRLLVEVSIGHDTVDNFLEYWSVHFTDVYEDRIHSGITGMFKSPEQEAHITRVAPLSTWNNLLIPALVAVATSTAFQPVTKGSYVIPRGLIA